MYSSTTMTAHSNRSSSSSSSSSRKRVVFKDEIEIFDSEFEAASRGEPPSDVIQDVLHGEAGRTFVALVHKLCYEQEFSQATPPRSWIWHFLRDVPALNELDSTNLLIAAFARVVAEVAPA